MPASFFENVAWQAAQKSASASGNRKAAAIVSAASLLRSGDVAGAINEAINVFIPAGNSSATGSSGSSVSSGGMLVNGVSMAEARQLFREVAGTKYARKNLFHVRLSSVSPGLQSLSFNFFCVDVSYSYTISGEKVKIGAGSMDIPQGSEPFEVSVLTLDSEDGDLKKWFAAAHSRVAHADGTFGLPAEYVLKMEVLHGFATHDVSGASEGFKDTFIVRPASMQIDLSRRESALQELQMTFSQFDTFSAL